MRPLLNEFAWFSQDITTNQVLSRQKGVVRINCLDCLDRTNVAQMKVAEQILIAQVIISLHFHF